MLNRRNIKLLDKDQLSYLKNKYIISIKAEKVCVELINRNQRTLHDMSEAFSVRSKNRRVTINPFAIEIWKENFYNEYTIFDVQNAINELIVEKQNLDIDTIQKRLRESE